MDQIPFGRVTTYGRLAAMSGRPKAARIVGGIAHYGPPSLPWHRVVKSGGRMAEGYPGGTKMHQSVLESESIRFTSEGIIQNLEIYLWPGLQDVVDYGSD